MRLQPHDERTTSKQVGTWLSLVERTLGVGEVASSNLVVPTIIFSELDQPMRVDGSNLGSAEVQ